MEMVFRACYRAQFSTDKDSVGSSKRPINLHLKHLQRASLVVEVGCLHLLNVATCSAVTCKLSLPTPGDRHVPRAPRGGFLAPRRSLHRSSSPIFFLGIDHVIPFWREGPASTSCVRSYFRFWVRWDRGSQRIVRVFPTVVGRRGFDLMDAWPTHQAGNDRPSGHVTWTRSGRSRAFDFVSAGYEQEGGVGKGRHVRGYALASSFAMRFDWTDAKPSFSVRSDLDHACLTLMGWSRPSKRKGHARHRSDLHAVSLGHRPLLRRCTRSFSGSLHGNSMLASWWGCDVHASSKRRSR